jgi:DNA repair exonuclease SbcCD ATPase subunit
LDELQNEANCILEQIKPGLQLNFSVQKTKNDGEIDDDLDIEYFLNGKTRDYAQLSGAQKLSVMFSLKIGVALLLKKNIGVNISFLLLDEIDQALDKASVDAFAEIIRFFQKDFKILVITHNDRLKDKFSNYILVEQDLNGTSRSTMVRSIN